MSKPARLLSLVALGHLGIELCSQFLPVLYPVLIAALGLTYTQVGAIAMVAGIGTSLAQPLFGYLSDRWRPGRISALSVAWIGLIMGTVGLTSNYGLLLVLVGLGVLGSAAFHPPAATIASSVGGSRRGAAVSVFSVGGSIGSALSPLLVTLGIGWFGRRGTFILIPVTLLISVLLYRQLGQLTGDHADGAERRQAEPNKGALVSLLLIMVAVMSLAWFQQSFKTYLPLWIESQGGTVETGGRMLFLMLACLGVGSLLGGSLSDRVGRWQIYVLCLGLLVPVAWTFVSLSGLAQVLSIALAGVLIGATFPMSIVMAQETWPSGVGIASGLAMGLGWVPGGIGASITGVLADRFGLAFGLRSLAAPVAVGTIAILVYAVLQQSVARSHRSASPERA